MMYSEFIKMTEFGESYITYDMYNEYIEPVYMMSSLNKQAFCKRFYKLHTDIITPLIEAKISSLGHKKLEEFVFGGEKEIIAGVDQLNKELIELFCIAVWKGKYNNTLKSVFNYKRDS